jgi:hypothetical protein
MVGRGSRQSLGAGRLITMVVGSFMEAGGCGGRDRLRRSIGRSGRQLTCPSSDSGPAGLASALDSGLGGSAGFPLGLAIHSFRGMAEAVLDTT